MLLNDAVDISENTQKGYTVMCYNNSAHIQPYVYEHNVQYKHVYINTVGVGTVYAAN